MDDSPMLNTPAETGMTAGEEFEKNKIRRLDRLRADMHNTPAGPPEQEMERIEKFKKDAIARFSELTGLSFDADGRCTTPGKIRMEGEFKERWKQLCAELAAQNDPQRAEQLFGEAGKMLRGAARQNETDTDS